MLKLLDILIRPVDETPPTVRIHIPSTPISETAPPLPSAKIPIKPLKPVAKTPSTKSPVVPNNNPPKLKLPGGAATPTDGPRLVLQSRPSTPKHTTISIPASSENRNAKISIPGLAPAPKRKGRPPKSSKPGH